MFLNACRQGFIDSLKDDEYRDDYEQINLLPAIKAIRPDLKKPGTTGAGDCCQLCPVRCFGESVTRTLKVSADHLLKDLAEAILDAFDFDSDHLYHFQYLNPFGADRIIDHPAVVSCDACVTETRLRQLEPVPGMKITFVFDYGDNWKFDIVVMHGSEESMSDIQVIERKGEAPEHYPDYEDIY